MIDPLSFVQWEQQASCPLTQHRKGLQGEPGSLLKRAVFSREGLVHPFGLNPTESSEQHAAASLLQRTMKCV